jgi:hypothetical protein
MGHYQGQNREHITRSEFGELAASQARGASDRWGNGAVERDGGWLLFGLETNRIYAPLEHPEIPHLFAKIGHDEKALIPFAETYGRLGWSNLQYEEIKDHWLKQAVATWAQLVGTHGEKAAWSEPIEWIRAHARTVQWCLQVGAALNAKNARKRKELCEQLAANLPRPAGIRAILRFGPFTREKSEQDKRPPDFIGKILEDLLWANLRGVRRLVEYRDGKLHAMWGGNSLIESIYTLVTDSITGGSLSQCKSESCGATFIKTDGRQEYCPPRYGQSKSTCMNRDRHRRQRAKPTKERP